MYRIHKKEIDMIEIGTLPNTLKDFGRNNFDTYNTKGSNADYRTLMEAALELLRKGHK
jgi:hypothetical protein